MTKFNSKIKAILFFLVVCVFSTLLICGCSNSSTSKSGKIEITDLSGRTITLDKPAEKIIALSASDCEVFYAIDAGDTLIGRGTYCDYPDQVMQLKDYGSGELMNLEEIVAAKPDVVVMAKSGFTLDQVQSIENAGIKTFVNEPTSLEDTYTYINLLGKLTGKEDNAKKVVSDMKSGIDKVKEKVAKNPSSSKSIYYEVSPLQYGLWAAGSGTFMSEIADILKINNIFSDIQDWSEVSAEQVIKRNPDFIVSVTMYFGSGPRPEDEIMSRAGWENINAIKNKKVTNVDNSSITRPGPRLVDALNSIYQFVYE